MDQGISIRNNGQKDASNGPQKQVLPKEKKEKVVGAATSHGQKPFLQKGKKEKAAPLPPVFPRRRDPDAPVVRKVRLSVDVLPETHKRLKIRAIEQDSDIMRYVEMLIERDLSKK